MVVQTFLLRIGLFLSLLFLSIFTIIHSTQWVAAQNQPAELHFPDEPTELVVFDFNEPATVDHHGFPMDEPPNADANGDWTQPVNFADGVIHFRVEIRSQPVVKDMLLQLCFWQHSLEKETCGSPYPVTGSPGTVVTWSEAIPSMWKKDDVPLDWNMPRQRVGIAIKTVDHLPVSDYLDWAWNEEDPAEWYPLDMHFSAVVVAQGESFSGWHNFVDNHPAPTEVPTETPIDTPTEIPTETPTETPTEVPTEVPTATPTETPTETPTLVPTQTPTETPTQTPTETSTLVPTQTPTETPTEIPTETPAETPTGMPTFTPTVKWTSTPASMFTSTPTATGIILETPTHAPATVEADVPATLTSEPTENASTPTATFTIAPIVESSVTPVVSTPTPIGFSESHTSSSNQLAEYDIYLPMLSQP